MRNPLDPKLPHESLIDPVFQPRAAATQPPQTPPEQQTATIAKIQNREPSALRLIGFKGLARQTGEQVLVNDCGGPNAEHAEFRQTTRGVVGAIARREDPRVVYAVHLRADA